MRGEVYGVGWGREIGGEKGIGRVICSAMGGREWDVPVVNGVS